jgi:hypothetical protein
LGPREQPSSHLPRLLVDARPDVAEQFRRILDFVEHNRKPEFLDQSAGIGTGAGLHVRVLQQYVAGAWKELAQQAGLPGPAFLAGASSGPMTFQSR